MKKILFALALLFFMCSINAWSGTVDLGAIGDITTWPDTDYRWMDIADNVYRISYRDPESTTYFTYNQPNVTLTYNDTSNTFSGILTATGLKPNFAYQMKLVGLPGTYDWANEQIGYAGRWWRQEPNPNNTDDSDYKAHNDDPNYVFQGYLLFDFFVTDEQGDATVNFSADSSYHVLWKTSQRTWTSSDGPITTTIFDPSIGTFYDTDYPQATVDIYAEWEPGRALSGELVLTPGEYDCQFILTEESFHQSGLGGYWASAIGGDVTFTVVPIPASIYLLGGGLIGLIGIRRKRK